MTVSMRLCVRLKQVLRRVKRWKKKKKSGAALRKWRHFDDFLLWQEIVYHRARLQSLHRGTCHTSPRTDRQTDRQTDRTGSAYKISRILYLSGTNKLTTRNNSGTKRSGQLPWKWKYDCISYALLKFLFSLCGGYTKEIKSRTDGRTDRVGI